MITTHRTLFAVLSCTLLAACGAGASSVDISTHIDSTSVSDGIVRSESKIVLTGAINDRVTIDTIEADGAPPLLQLSPTIYENDESILAAFENYYAGGGIQAVIRRSDANALTIEKRFTEEGSAESAGGCTDWTVLKQYPVLAEGTVITITHSGSLLESEMGGCGEW